MLLKSLVCTRPNHSDTMKHSPNQIHIKVPFTASHHSHSFCLISHLLFARERVVVTRHISHDGLLIWPQGANDVCPGNRGKGEKGRGEKNATRVKECRDKRASRWRKHKTQGISSPPGFSPHTNLFEWRKI